MRTFIIVVICVCINIFIWYKAFEKEIKGAPKTSTLGINIQNPITPKETAAMDEPGKKEDKVENSKELDERVKKALEGTKGNYSIAIKNLKTEEMYYLDENRKYESGSLYKLWTMATVYKQIEDGKLKEDQVLSQTIPELNRKFGIDPEYAELTTGGITMPVKQALTQMITISHNYAALLLTEKIKLSSVAAFLKEEEFNDSEVGTDGDVPKTTAKDIAIFMEKLYKGEIANEENTQKMIELLKKQKLNKKLPKDLPKETVIAHKTGELGWFSHDAGIVYGEKGDYIIVVLTETSLPKAAEDRIANISKEVFDYFENK